MILAQEQGAELVIIDDNAAKKTAKYLGLKVTGTLGVVLRAKNEGLIKSVKTIMEKLSNDGFFIGEEVKRLVLREAGEE